MNRWGVVCRVVGHRWSRESLAPDHSPPLQRVWCRRCGLHPSTCHGCWLIRNDLRVLGSAVLPEPALPLGGRRLRVPCRPGTRDVFHFSQQLDEFQRQAGGFAPRHGAP